MAAKRRPPGRSAIPGLSGFGSRPATQDAKAECPAFGTVAQLCGDCADPLRQVILEFRIKPCRPTLLTADPPRRLPGRGAAGFSLTDVERVDWQVIVGDFDHSLD